MPVELNHTIVAARDMKESAEFLADVLGLAAPTPFGPFLVVQVNNSVSLDFSDSFGLDERGGIASQHYAFLVGEPDFDEIRARIVGRGLTYWADSGQNRPGEINTGDGGRGLYWEDPSGHILEIITKPYGG